MNLAKFSDNRIIVTGGILLAVITSYVHYWNRVSNNTVNLSTVEEKNIASLIFIATLSITYALPFIHSLFLLTKNNGGSPSWPVFEVKLVASGILGIAVLSLGIVYLPLGFLGIHQAEVGVFLGYGSVIVAYWLTLKKLIISWRNKSWGKLVAYGCVLLLISILIYVISWALVYFE